MDVYADTSFLFSYYLPDANSPKARNFMLTFGAPLPLTALHRLELRNSISLAVFRKAITPAEAAAAWADVEVDVQAGRLVALSVNWPDVFGHAENLARQESPVLGARSIDVLHVASARRIGAIDFLSFDMRQATLAQTIGLNVKP